MKAFSAVIAEGVVLEFKKAWFKTMRMATVLKKVDFSEKDLKPIIDRLILYDILVENMFGMTLSNNYKNYIHNLNGIFYPIGHQRRIAYVKKGWDGVWVTLFRKETLSGVLSVLLAVFAIFIAPLLGGKDESKQKSLESSETQPTEQKANLVASDSVPELSPNDSTTNK